MAVISAPSLVSQAWQAIILYFVQVRKHCANVFCMYLLPTGILMGAWPCGKIVMLGELFGSESISQVYGQVHTLLQETPQQFSKLSKSETINLI